jgi:hypothetical protein
MPEVCEPAAVMDEASGVETPAPTAAPTEVEANAPVAEPELAPPAPKAAPPAPEQVPPPPPAAEPAAAPAPVEKPADQPAEKTEEKPAEKPDAKKTEKGFDDPFSTDTNALKTWVDASGRYRIEARFVGVVEGGVVRLQRADGRFVRVAIDRLSATDQQWVRDAGHALAMK